MAQIFIINIFFLFSLSLNATTINQVFGSSDDTSNSPPGTKAEAVFGNYSKSPVKAAEPAKETNKEEVGGETKESAKEETKAETKEETKEEPKEAATGSSHHRAAAVFGRSSSEGSAESSGSGGSRAAAVFGSRRSSRSHATNEAQGKGGQEKEGRGRGNEAEEHENPRSAPNYMWPVDGGRITAFYGWRSSRRFHDGIDISAPSGTNVFASKSGEVIYSGNRIRGYGNMVVIRHNSGYSTVYAHNKANLVNKGDIVRQGDIIAHVGSTGHSSGPHSHFEVRKGKFSADPLKFLSSYDVKKHSGSYANSKDNPF